MRCGGVAMLALGCGRSSTELGVGDVFVARDEAGQAIEFRIDAAEKDKLDSRGDYLLYTLSARAAGGEMAPYCEPDADGLRQAIPVPGAWDELGNPVALEGATTIACTNGAIAKCVRLGYKPWLEAPGKPMKALHQACTRMIRADYCGDGSSHTKDGTRIDVFDSHGIQARDERAEAPEVFEAAWGPNGAVYVNTLRWQDDVRALVAECPDRLAGNTSLDKLLTPDQVAAKYGKDLVFNGRFVAPEDRVFSSDL